MIYGNYRKTYLIYGCVIGGCLVLTMALHRLLFPSNPPMSPENYITDAVLAIGICLVFYFYRASLPEQKVMVKELMLLGVGLGMVSSIVYGMLLWLLCGSLLPDFVSIFIDNRISQMSETSDLEAVSLVRGYTAGDWAFIGAFRTFVISILVSFLGAVFFRTEKTPLKG